MVFFEDLKKLKLKFFLKWSSKKHFANANPISHKLSRKNAPASPGKHASVFFVVCRLMEVFFSGEASRTKKACWDRLLFLEKHEGVRN